MSEKPTTMK